MLRPQPRLELHEAAALRTPLLIVKEKLAAFAQGETASDLRILDWRCAAGDSLNLLRRGDRSVLRHGGEVWEFHARKQFTSFVNYSRRRVGWLDVVIGSVTQSDFTVEWIETAVHLRASF
jgi:hypothetical protein